MLLKRRKKQGHHRCSPPSVSKTKIQIAFAIPHLHLNVRLLPDDEHSDLVIRIHPVVSILDLSRGPIQLTLSRDALTLPSRVNVFLLPIHVSVFVLLGHALSWPTPFDSPSDRHLLAWAIVLILRLLEQEVCSKLLVLVAGEVSLSSLFAVEAQPTQAFDGVALLFSDLNGVSSGRERCVIVATALAEELEELVLVLSNQLGELGVSGTELLQNRLQHLGLLLDNLAKLLELGVVSQEVEVTESLLVSSCCTGCGGRHSCCRCGIRASTRRTTSTAATLLCGEVEQVDVAVIVITARCGSCSWLCGGLSSRGLRLLLKVLGDTLE